MAYEKGETYQYTHNFALHVTKFNVAARIICSLALRLHDKLVEGQKVTLL
jgi:hypothetical protein